MYQESLVADILKLLIPSTVVWTVLLAASIFQTIIVIVVIKILEKYLFKKFSFRNCFLETLCKYTPLKGRNAEELKYGAASMLQGQVFLKAGVKRGGGGEGWKLSFLIFSRFTIFTVRNFFTLCKSVLCIWRKIIFVCYRNFMKTGHSKLS